MVKIHLNKEAADVGLENRMNRDFFALEYLTDRANLPARDHIQITVVDRCSSHGASLVVVRHESEIEPLTSRGVQIVRTLLRCGNSLAQAIYLLRLFVNLFLRNVDGHIELRGF